MWNRENNRSLQEKRVRGCCESCGKEDQPLVIDPYMEDVENVERECFLCEECYIDYCGDI